MAIVFANIDLAKSLLALHEEWMRPSGLRWWARPDGMCRGSTEKNAGRHDLLQAVIRQRQLMAYSVEELGS